MRIDTVLFDLDGTLINTNEIIINSFKHVFETHFTLNVLTRKEILTFFGPTLKETFGKYTDSQKKILEMEKMYLSHYKEIECDMYELYPGVLEVLQNLKQTGYNLGIVTTKYRKSAMPSIVNFKLDEIFEVIVTLDDVNSPKPSCEPIEVALRNFPGYKKIMMVGDNRNDILAGKNASVYTAGVAWTIIGKKSLKELNPDFMLKNMHELIDILNEFNQDDK
ncbi:pyrophosphatase PpaX [Mycoplasmatota bacterium zrk1]